MFVLSRIYERLRSLKVVQEFLSGLVPALSAVIAVAAFQLGSKTIYHKWQIAVSAVSFLLLVRFKINPAWLLMIMAVAGLLLKLS
jgi:chromate transport protein ChrA